MPLNIDLDQLQRDVEYLLDRTAIADCIAAHARGCDRHDVELLASTYLDDGVDVHGATVNAGPDYAAWANVVHAATLGERPAQRHDRTPARSTATRRMPRATCW